MRLLYKSITAMSTLFTKIGFKMGTHISDADEKSLPPALQETIRKVEVL